MNWVEKRWQEEQFLAANGDLLWRDLCNALKEAAHSYRDRYQGIVTVEDEKRETQLRIAVGEFSKQAILDLDFDSRRIKVVCRSGFCKSFTIDLYPDPGTPYLVAGESAPLSTEEASQLILQPAFFPESPSQFSYV
jgi:rhodanese-related sulfurtransferase